ncbi:hypothetical protein PVK06_028750 [Gossypium arboreum]|uniref:MULE transposase domain-containing protein n=1 Tax=Gossypium arboreum TaxID=29729 RepID=A0ABR0P4P9_GOSAR|nr:hypothetical protein PVK06_028750 [Gossypium arboreum]
MSVAPDIDVVGDDGYNSSDPCDQEVDSDSDLDMDEVPDYIDDEDVNDDRNINASSVGNQIRHTVIHNNPGPHMSLIDPEAAHILLLALAQDGNKNVLLIAFAIVDKENIESWTFFFTNLRRYVISNDNIYIISDRGKRLIAAIRRSGVPWRAVYCI